MESRYIFLVSFYYKTDVNVPLLRLTNEGAYDWSLGCAILALSDEEKSAYKQESRPINRKEPRDRGGRLEWRPALQIIKYNFPFSSPNIHSFKISLLTFFRTSCTCLSEEKGTQSKSFSNSLTTLFYAWRLKAHSWPLSTSQKFSLILVNFVSILICPFSTTHQWANISQENKIYDSRHFFSSLFLQLGQSRWKLEEVEGWRQAFSFSPKCTF